MTMLRLRSGLRPLHLLLIVAAVVLLQCCTGCATATRVTVTQPGGKTITVVLPKNYSAEQLAFDLDPATGALRFRGSQLRSDASGVIDSAGRATGEVIEKITPLVPLGL